MSTPKEYCCLQRIGSNTKKNRLIRLEDKFKVVIGRSPDAHVCLVSTMISRKHAYLQKLEDGSWTVTDNKSCNGVYVNEQKLVPGQACVLKEGDFVQFGVKPTVDKPPEWLYKFHTNLRIMKTLSQNDNTGTENNSLDTQESIGLNNSTAVISSQRTSPHKSDTVTAGSRKRKSDCFDEDKDCNAQSSAHHKQEPSKPPDPSASPSKSDVTLRSPPVKKKLQWSPSTQIEERLREQERLAAEKLREQEKRLQAMQEEIRQREQQQQQLEQQLLEKEQLLKEKLQEQHEQMDKDKKEFEERMRSELEQQVKDKEQALLTQLKAQQGQLEAQRQELEEKLQIEMETRLVEKDLMLEEELKQQKEKLDKIIEKKELEQRMLQKQLEDTSTENEKHKEGMLKAKEDVLSNFVDLMETELQCSICNELFIRATSLNCSHSFCSLCLTQWMEQKKECPVCRAAITSTVRSIVLDSYIDRMVEHLSDDLKKTREVLVEERKAEMKKREDAAAAAAAAATSTGRGRRGRGRGRGSRGRGGSPRGRGAMRQTVLAPIVIESESDDSLDDDDDDDDDRHSLSTESESSVDGDPEVYYGGYGECYICGRRGHWANGCPFR